MIDKAMPTSPKYVMRMMGKVVPHLLRQRSKIQWDQPDVGQAGKERRCFCQKGRKVATLFQIER